MPLEAPFHRCVLSVLTVLWLSVIASLPLLSQPDLILQWSAADRPENPCWLHTQTRFVMDSFAVVTSSTREVL